MNRVCFRVPSYYLLHRESPKPLLSPLAALASSATALMGAVSGTACGEALENQRHIPIGFPVSS